MCGIAGIFAYGANALLIDHDELMALNDAQRVRGPDGAGIWESFDRKVGLAHRRLAIIDLSDGGSQPMLSRNQTEVITFNGEIYNFRSLKRDLEKQGVSFKTESDTEILLEMYRCYGPEMLNKLRGMFAFAIWDSRHRELFLARDPFGIKPLYFNDDGRSIRFASQVKALQRVNTVRLSDDPAGHVGFFIFGFVPDPFTLYREIRSVPAGHYVVVREGGRRTITKYYDIGMQLAEASSCHYVFSPGEKTEIIRGALADTLSSHLESDVPIGVFLSAGIDSNVLAGKIVEGFGSEKVDTVTLGFDEFAGTAWDEIPLAESQARRLGTKHTSGRISERDFFGWLDSIWDDMDQPSIDGVNSWLVSRLAAEAGLKVCLSGVGGDELFGGYSSYSQVPKLANALSKLSLPRAFTSFFRSAIGIAPERIVPPKIAGLFEYGATIAGSYMLRRGVFLPSELERLLDPTTIREGLEELQPLTKLNEFMAGIGSDRAKVASMELGLYMRSQLLRDADWASMAHGLELRTPFVDRIFFEAVLPTIVAKDPSSKINLLDSIPEEFSKDIRKRKKTGFVTPVRNWLDIRYTNFATNRGLRGWARVVYAQFVPELSLGPSEPIPPRLAGKSPILIYRIGQLGDTLISLPTFREIRDRFPDDQIVLLTDRHPSRGHYVSAWDVVGPTGLLDGVIYYPVMDGYWSKFWIYFRLAFKLRKLAPKVVINLAPRLRKQEVSRDTFFFKALVGTRTYVDLPAADMTCHASTHFTRAMPEWKRLLNVVAEEKDERFFELSLPPWAINEARMGLNAGDSIDAWIAIAPGSKMPAKRWPYERYDVLGRALLAEDRKVGLIVIGGPEDRDLGDKLCTAWSERAVNLAGSLSVFGSAAILMQCKAYIGNDSGAMHLAAQVGTPCVAIFSARDIAGKWDPYGDNNRVLRQKIVCEGCMLEICDRGNECLKAISVESVLNAYKQIYNASLKVG